MSINWEEKFSVGVKEIDEQHKNFIIILNKAYDSFYALAEKEQLEELVLKIINYAELHFSTEEKYFDKFNYEFADQHKEKHRKLTERAVMFKKEFEIEGNKIIPNMVDFLEDWLVKHLINEDQKYIKCFHDNGLF